MNREVESEDSRLLSRGEFLKRGVAIGAVIAVPAIGTAHVGGASAATVSATELGRRSALGPDESALLVAMVERLVPKDAYGPGGNEAGAAAYIEKSLGGGLAGGLSGAASLYSSGLAAVDAYATSTYGSPFTALPPNKQDAVLTDMASNKAAGFTPDSFTFFSAVHEHTLQGMFSDPVYGGNKNFAGWSLLGYPGVKMPVAPSDQKIGAKVTAVHQSTYAGGQFAAAKKEAVA